MPMFLPLPLQPGDRIAIVATAKKLPHALQSTIKILEAWELEVEVHPNTYLSSGYFAGTDKERVNALQETLDDSGTRAILFARGGYGTTRIIDQLNWANFLSNPKWLIGFSDLTNVLLQLNHLDVVAIHGAMAYTLPWHLESQKSLHALLFGTKNAVYEIKKDTMNKEGVAEGCITGGNLSLISESIGTKQEIQIDGQILLLEEVGEATYSIDRMLNRLKRMGKLEKVAGLLVGNISQDGQEDGFGSSAYEVIHSYFSHLDVPLAFGLAMGHEQRNDAIMVNCPCQVEVIHDKVQIKYFIE